MAKEEDVEGTYPDFSQEPDQLWEYYGKHQTRLERLAARIIRDPDLANGVVLDTLSQLYKKILDGKLGYRGDGPFEAYLYKAVRYSTIDSLRKMRRRETRENRSKERESGNAPEAVSATQVDFVQEVVERDYGKQLERRLEQLRMNSKYQEVFKGRIVLGLSSTENAERLDITRVSERQTFSRAMRIARKGLV